MGSRRVFILAVLGFIAVGPFFSGELMLQAKAQSPAPPVGAREKEGITNAVDSPLTPEQALASFRLDSGLEIECVAAEPMVESPVAMTWDEAGRMFVVEDRGYPIGPGPDKKPAGRIVLLESSRQDGHYDKRTVFADELTFPNGVLCWRGGVFVTCAPYLYYLKDTNGDGVADVKQIIFQGFQDQSTTQQRVSHPVLNIDGWIYLTSGLTSANVSSPLYPAHPAVACDYTDFRFRPDTDQFEAAAGTAQFGETFDSFGHKFICSNRNHAQAVMLQLKYANRNPLLNLDELVEDIPDHGAAGRVFPLSANITTVTAQAGYFTSACGIFYGGGTALPAEYRDNSFTCEPAGNLVHRDVISATNSTFVARRAAEGVEFLASRDNWFRPVNLASGPDGALYVCDMYRKTIEHPAYLSAATRQITDFDSGKDKGRIYRITAKNALREKMPSDLQQASIAELCEMLNDRDAWWRTTAQRLLLERRDTTATPQLRLLAQKAQTPETRVLALHLLDGLGDLSDEDIAVSLSDENPGVRENAIQLAETRLVRSRRLADQVLAMAKDVNARVRFQCALSLGELDDPRVVSALAEIVTRAADDRWARAAAWSAVGSRTDELLHALLGAAGNNADRSAMLEELCRMCATTESTNRLASLVDEIAAGNEARDAIWQEAALNGLADGLKARTIKGENLRLTDLVKGDSPVTRLTRERVEYLTRNASGAITNEAEPLDARLVALRFFMATSWTNEVALLQGLVEPRQPVEIQVAAVRGLEEVSETDIAALLAGERWNTYTPPLREALVSFVVTRPGLIRTLLDGISNGEIPVVAINQDRREELLQNADAETKARAMAIFKRTPRNGRMKIYEDCKSVLSLQPDATNGHRIFSNTCAVCHKFGGEGYAVGPDLTGVRNQTGETLLLDIVVPEYEIAPIYTCYTVTTKEGNSITGLLAVETTGSITIRQALGHEETIARSNIARMVASRLSLMPDGLEETMTRQELADLIGFLRGL